ncbi:uncharacterized protein BP01DRAFT_291085 [Aspergillus saccharolyticus JOP 1030-1]|uniref:Endosomal/vacuolar adapter protein YPT35 n=1 Tax=Aspergillus saccharolyticus JOP 1030-1 TaxID=1450539 RepID=A0A318ZJC0_9EURO|nr:PX domain protein [Aspergillus saccharolyticus JOP 1030-1]PYH47671.1 PX domain protein [Aspergillus saccharolyticus JOP 1030-1]
MESANEDTGLVPSGHAIPPSSASPAISSIDKSTPNTNTASTNSEETTSVYAGNILNNERPVSGIVPPYWTHHRAASRVSQISLDAGPAITLEDHTEDPECETSRGLWAKSVSVDDYVVVQGKTGIGSYVVWNCKVQTLDGGPITVRLRYSEFDDLRQRLIISFPHAKNALPPLPPKSVIFKFRPKFLESRRVGLEYFLNCVLLNPEFSSSPIVKEFLFGRAC